jgi:predicted lipid-binding transport protein (Tim44 family)
MKHHNRLTLFASTSVVAFFLLTWTTACHVSSAPTPGSANQPAVTIAPAANQPATAKLESDGSSGGSLASPTQAYKTAYAARQKKDLEDLKRVLSKEMLGFLQDIGKSEQKTLDDELKELIAAPQAPTAEVRNEKIAGNNATLEYLDEKGKWSPMGFVKEGDDWKMTLPHAPAPVIEQKPRKNR